MYFPNGARKIGEKRKMVAIWGCRIGKFFPFRATPTSRSGNNSRYGNRCHFHVVEPTVKGEAAEILKYYQIFNAMFSMWTVSGNMSLIKLSFTWNYLEILHLFNENTFSSALFIFSSSFCTKEVDVTVPWLSGSGNGWNFDNDKFRITILTCNKIHYTLFL